MTRRTPEGYEMDGRTRPVFDAYERAYRAIRARYGWDAEPVIYRASKVWQILEPLPPRHLSGDAYGPYFGEVMALYEKYAAVIALAEQLERKRLPDREKVEAMVAEAIRTDLAAVRLVPPAEPLTLF